MKAGQTVVVVGAGAFGTALAAVLSLQDRLAVTLLGRDPDRMGDLARRRHHEKALPGIALPERLAVSSTPADLAHAEIVLFAMPSQAQADAALHYGPFLSAEATVVTCAKGLDRSTTRLLSDGLEERLPHHPIAVLSGPGFARDLAQGLPTAMALASRSLAAAEDLARTLSTRHFRLYASDDRIGVQLGGALKNVLAIACGIVEGRGLGESARAALIARGLAEMSRLAVAMGGKADTVRGLSGLGDLVLTATSHQSRNLCYGLALAAGTATTGNVLVEGAFAAGAIDRLARDRHLAMPITAAVARILEGSLSIDAAVTSLMTRPITTE